MKYIKCLQNEVWLPVIGFEKYYMVSNMGRVQSRERVRTVVGKMRNLGTYKRWFGGNLLKSYENKFGYKSLDLSVNRKTYSILVHRLVAQSFIPNIDHKPCVNHIDLNPRNNNAENLEWVTYQENEQHKRDTNKNIRYRKGQDAVNTHLSNESVIQMRWIMKNIDGVVANDLADLYGISYQAMNGIRKNRNWKSLELAE